MLPARQSAQIGCAAWEGFERAERNAWHSSLQVEGEGLRENRVVRRREGTSGNGAVKSRGRRIKRENTVLSCSAVLLLQKQPAKLESVERRKRQSGASEFISVSLGSNPT